MKKIRSVTDWEYAIEGVSRSNKNGTPSKFVI